MRAKFCNRSLQFKLPEELTDAVAAVARRQMMSRSAYVRQALSEKLQRDGINPKLEGAEK